jgi:hypothetical protein
VRRKSGPMTYTKKSNARTIKKKAMFNNPPKQKQTVSFNISFNWFIYATLALLLFRYLGYLDISYLIIILPVVLMYSLILLLRFFIMMTWGKKYGKH